MSDTFASLIHPLQGYGKWLANLQSRIHNAQQRATIAVIRELAMLYCQVGRDSQTRQAKQARSAEIIELLAQSLGACYPCIKGEVPCSQLIEPLRAERHRSLSSIEPIERELVMMMHPWKTTGND